MKLHGKKLEPKIEVLVLPRQSGDLVFKARMAPDDEEYDKINPRPQPPIRLLPGGIRQQNTEDPTYDKNLDKWATDKWNWMVLKSLEATPGLEWETVKMDDPSTYGNWKTEMKEAGISPNEIARLESLVTDACGLNQHKIDQATKAFLAGQGQEPEEQSSPSSEQSSMPSGEPASAPA